MRDKKRDYWRKWYAKPENRNKENVRWRMWFSRQRVRENQRSLDYYYANRERINAKRRARYRDKDVKYIIKLVKELSVSVQEARRLKAEMDQKQL